MKMIAAVGKKGEIGNRGGLLASLPGDMKYFRQQTMGKTVIMGRATLESFPGGKPLPKRRNIVLSTKLEPGQGYEVCRDLDELLELVKDEPEDDLMVIGGGSIYTMLRPYCEEALITEIDSEFEADTYIEPFGADPEWEKVQESEPAEENGHTYRFVIYRRKG